MSLVDIVRQMEAVRFLVIGDAMTDRYVFGRVERVCPEAPVPVFIPERTEERPGGAANVLDQLREYRCKGMGLFGLRSTKHRYMVGHHLMLRVDEDRDGTPTDGEVETVIHNVRYMQPLSVVILSDYAKGWLSPEMCKNVIQFATERNVPVVVDPKGSDWSKYEGASVICPNEREWEAVKLRVPKDTAVIAKHGDKGIALVVENAYQESVATLFPARAQHVFDVTGAGDTVVATVAAAIAAGAALEDAAQLAVLASGWVVGEIGTTVCPWRNLLGFADAHEKGRQ